MPLYAFTYTHPDAEGWQNHLMAHVGWLREMVAQGVLKASGPLKGTAHHAALLPLRARSRRARRDYRELSVLDRGTDPSTLLGTDGPNMTVTEWDPIFGAFNAESSMPQG